MSESDQALMKLIKDQYGAQIAQVCQGTRIPPAFLAALVANESGGNANAKRFEAGVLTSLWNVLQGRKASYGSIGAGDLRQYVLPAQAVVPVNPFTLLDELANSWGLTQIMGYHVFDLHTTIDALQTAGGNLAAAVRLAAQFATQFSLDPDADAGDLFRCWNTGRPDGTTYDPAYVPNGMTRMALYEALP
jgi:hypothetical protein